MRKNGISMKKATRQVPDVVVTDFSQIPFEIAGNEAAVQVWKRYSEHFQKLGLRKVDTGLLAMFCAEYSKYWQMTKYLLEAGNVYIAANGIPTPRPEVKICRDSFSNAVKLSSKFGLALLDRQKLESVEEDGPIDPKAEKLKRMAG